MRIARNLGLSLAALIFAALLLPGAGWAGTGPVTKNCPTEPTQNVPIASGVTYYGANCVLQTTGDVDSFQFSAAAGSTYRVVAGLGASPTTDVCLALYVPGSTTPIATGCSSRGYGVNAVVINQKLTVAGLYTIVVSESSNATLSYGLSLERLSPAPPDAIPVTLSKAITGAVGTPTAQDAYTFNGSTAGTYQITASWTAGPSHDVCFDVYQPDGKNVVLGACTSIGYGVDSVTKDITPAQSGAYVVVVYSAGDDGTVNYNFEISCLLGTCPSKCLLQDALSYTSGTLTMNFTIGTPYAATWNTWLVSGETAQLLWSLSQPITEPQVAVSKTQAVPASGAVGVLSTLTTAKQGITCSSWNRVSTGTP